MTLPPLARAAFWMAGALFVFSLMAVSIRALAASMNLFEIFAVRTGTGLAVMLALLLFRPSVRPAIKTLRPGLHCFRAAIHLSAQFLWAKSILLLPLATVFALEFTAPAWTLLLVVPVLGERMTTSRIGSVVLGLVGVLVILRPGSATFQPAALFVLAAAVGFAGTMITTKMLTMTDSTFAIIFWMNVIQFPLTLLGSDPSFVLNLTVDQIPALLAVGFTGLLSHYCLANAFRAADASVVVPLDFLRIPLIALVGWWLYGERIDIFVFVGAGFIIAGVLWNLHSEAARSVASPAVPAPPVTDRK